jgi:hypothetical protein
MSRFLSLCLVLCLSSFALASSVQVVYVAQGTSIVTYNVDAQTLNYTQVGTLSIKGASTFGTVVPSPNDHFIYVMAADATQTTHLYVYATGANGAPESRPTQTLYAKSLKSLQLDPNGNFLYAVYATPTASGSSTVYSIRRFVVNPANGTVSQPLTPAKYTLNTYAGYTCSVSITGFNSNATELYDNVYCITHEGPYATYYERTVNSTTGALGPDVQIYTWGSDGNGSFEAVQFVGNRMFDFVYPDYGTPTSMNIYPAVPNTSKPVLQCTASMLAACGAPNGVVAHPSGRYLFIGNSSGSATEIEQIEYSQKKIVDTGNQVLYTLGTFGPPLSPDGSLVFGLNYTGPGYYLQVSGFNVSTAQVTSGATIWVPSSGPNNLENAYFTATRF